LGKTERKGGFMNVRVHKTVDEARVYAKYFTRLNGSSFWQIYPNAEGFSVTFSRKRAEGLKLVESMDRDFLKEFFHL
jgi:hypothetical protein